MSQSNTWAERDQGAAAPDLSVIIVSWNVRDLLARCLEALSSNDVREDLLLEIIVVDNASKDGSAQVARGFEGVRVIETGKNLGYGRANNIGLTEANGRHLLILNPDTVPQPGSLTALLRFLDRCDLAGIVSPRLLNPDGSVQSAAFRFPTLLMAALDLFPLPGFVPGRLRAWVAASRLNGRYPDEATAARPFPIDHPLGACMLLRREAYEQAGGFDPRIHMYAEEIDLAIRYRQAGWECWQVPAARVVHLGGQSTGQVRDRMFIELWRSRLYLYRKHYTGTDLALLRWLLVISQLLAAIGALMGRLAGKLDAAAARKRARRALRVLRLALRA